MATKRTVGEAGQTVELADKETSFYDPQTRLDVTRDAKVKLGDTIGKKTQTALLSGRLLVVGGKFVPDENAVSAKGGKKAEATEE